MIKPYNNIVDMTGKPCINGCGGVYRDSTIIEDLEDVIHCIVCHDRIKRFQTVGPEDDK